MNFAYQSSLFTGFIQGGRHKGVASRHTAFGKAPASRASAGYQTKFSLRSNEPKGDNPDLRNRLKWLRLENGGVHGIHPGAEEGLV
jgi:hypothetical protein